MKMRHVLPCVIAVMTLFSVTNAQPKAGTIKVNDATITTTGPVNDGQLNETWTSEFKGKHGNIFRKVTYKKNLKGEWSFSAEDYSSSGKIVETLEGSIDTVKKRFIISKYKHARFDKNGKQTHQSSAEKGPNGKMHAKEGLDNQPKKEYDLADDEMTFPNVMYLYPLNHSDNTEVSELPIKKFENYAFAMSDASCANAFVISLGPSYLIRDFGDETKSAFGVHFIANYNFNNHIAAGLDVSTYSAKVGNEKLNTSFYLLDGTYTFGKGSQKCYPPISVFGRIAIGMMHERYAKKKESGIAYGAGAGANWRISRVVKIGLITDFLWANIADKKIKNVRASIFVVTLGVGNKLITKPRDY